MLGVNDVVSGGGGDNNGSFLTCYGSTLFERLPCSSKTRDARTFPNQ